MLFKTYIDAQSDHFQAAFYFELNCHKMYAQDIIDSDLFIL